MGQRPTPFTPKFIPEIQSLTESHPDGNAADILSGNKKTPLTGSSQAIRVNHTPAFTGVRVFYTSRGIRQSKNLTGRPGRDRKWHLLNDIDLVPTELRGNAYWTIKLIPVWVTTQERGNQRTFN